MSKLSYLFCLLHTLNKGIVRKKCQDILLWKPYCLILPPSPRTPNSLYNLLDI